MTLDKIKAALDLYDVMLAPARWGPMHTKAAYLRDFSHRLRAMIDAEPQRREKIMRWYGYLQGGLWALDVYTVEQLKEHSRPDPGEVET